MYLTYHLPRAQFHVCGDANVRVVGGRCTVDVRVNVRSMCGSMCGRCAGRCAVNVRVNVLSMCGCILSALMLHFGCISDASLPHTSNKRLSQM